MGTSGRDVRRETRYNNKAMQYTNWQAIQNRLKSLLWRAGMLLLAMLVDFAIASLGDFNLPNGWTVLLGLILGEVSKYLNVDRAKVLMSRRSQ